MTKTNQQHKILYFIGVISMILAFGLFAFILYILPHLFFNYQYDVPYFVTYSSAWFQEHHSISGFILVVALLLPLILGCIVFGLIARFIDKYLNKPTQAKEIFIQKLATTDMEEADETQEPVPLFDEPRIEPEKIVGRRLVILITKFLLAIIGIIILIYLAEYFIVYTMKDFLRIRFSL